MTFPRSLTSSVSSLAIDVGGTFVKAARISEGQILGNVARVPTPGFLGRNASTIEAKGAREIDPGALDQALTGALREIRAHSCDIERVYVTGQMAGLAFVDDRGRALAPLISWQDSRYSDIDKVERVLGVNEVERLGDGLRVGLPLVTLAAHKRPRGSFVTSLIAYVAGRLARQRAQFVHVTDAASWGMLDVYASQWSEAACALVGLSQADLPRVTGKMGAVAPSSIVRVAVGDQQAALLGAGLPPGTVSVNLATGCQVSRLDSNISSTVQTRPYFGGLYLHTVTHLPAGRLLRKALIESRGNDSSGDWAWLRESGDQDPRVFGTGVHMAVAIKEAIAKLAATSHPLLLSGGLIQRVAWLRALVLDTLGNPPWTIFGGDDAAIAGLRHLSQED